MSLGIEENTKKFVDLVGLGKYTQKLKDTLANNSDDKFPVNYASTADEAKKAISDGDGLNITETYLKKVDAESIYAENSALEAEVTRAKVAEEVNANEISRVDESLVKATQVANEAKTVANNAIEAVGNETTRAKAAEKQLLDGMQAYVETTDGRLETLEAAKHEHDNKTILDGIDNNKVTQWNAAEPNLVIGVEEGTVLSLNDKKVGIDLSAYDTAEVADSKYDELGAANSAKQKQMLIQMK